MILSENSDQFYIRDEFKNFVCPECGLKFVTSLDVDLHLRQHTGEDLKSFGHGEVCSGTTEVYTCADRLICFDESSVKIFKSVNLHENSTANEIENDRSEQHVEDNKRSEQPIEDNRSSEQPMEDNRRSEQPIEGKRSKKPVSNNRRSKLQQPEENQRTMEQNIEDETSMIQLTGNKKLSMEEPNSVLQSIYEENVPQMLLKYNRKVQSRNHLIKSETRKQQPLKGECPNKHIKTEDHHCEYIIKKESYQCGFHSSTVDYEIPNELIEHLQKTASNDDQVNTNYTECQNNCSDCLEEHGHGIQYSESTDSHEPIQDLKVANFHNFDTGGAKQTFKDLGVTFQISTDNIKHGYIHTVTECGDISPVTESGVLQHQTIHTHTSDNLPELPKTSSILSPEKGLSTSINCQNSKYKQSPEFGSNGPSDEASDVTLNESDEITPELRIVPTDATIDEPNQDNPTYDLPLLEKFSPLKSKRDSFLTMPYLEPILPLINHGEDLSSIETKKKPLGISNGARIGQMKQVVSKHRKTREYVCESFHCYKTFFSNAGLQKHMVQFHPGYVPLSARIHQAPRPISKLNKPKTVKHVRFSEKNQIHIIEPIFNLPHGVKNGKYVCLKCKGVFDDTLDLRQHLNKFKNKLHCDKIKRLKKKGKGKSTVKVKVVAQENAGSDQTTSEALENACEPILESKLQEMDKNECSSAVDLLNNKDSEPFLTKCMNSNVISDNGKQSFACLKCSKIFFYKKSLKNHLKAHKDIERYLNEEFQCSICNTNFIYKKSFRKHMKKHNVSPQT